MGWLFLRGIKDVPIKGATQQTKVDKFSYECLDEHVASELALNRLVQGLARTNETRPVRLKFCAQRYIMLGLG